MLADELERALLNRPENGADGQVAPPAVVAGDMLPAAPEPMLTCRASAGRGAVPEPIEPAIEPAPAPPVAPKTATDVLAEAIAQRVAASAPAQAAAVDPVAAPPAPTPAARLAAAAAPSAPPPPVSAPTVAPAFEPASGDGTALMLAALSADPANGSDVIPASATRRDLAERAWRLHELGNSLASIRGALESSGGTPDDIGIIMAKLTALEQARQERFRRTLRNGIVAGVLILLVLVADGGCAGQPAPGGRAGRASHGEPVGHARPQQHQSGRHSGATQPAPLGYNPIIAFINQLIPGDVKLANGSTPTPAPTSAVLGVLFPATATATLSADGLATEAARESGLPPWVATLVPSGLTILNVPTPSIENSGPPNSPCPTTINQASALFGGPAADWAFNHDQQGWIFILAGSPIDIHVPANMTAGYLVIGATLEMRSAVGPATLHNVNFVAVSCQ